MYIRMPHIPYPRLGLLNRSHSYTPFSDGTVRRRPWKLDLYVTSKQIQGLFVLVSIHHPYAAAFCRDPPGLDLVFRQTKV
jgi:hypothetical protein